VLSLMPSWLLLLGLPIEFMLDIKSGKGDKRKLLKSQPNSVIRNPMTVRIRNWAVITKGGPYQAPECCRSAILGDVYNHPEFAVGDTVRTSHIVSAKGRLIQCYSRQYLLDGPPKEDYVKFCYEHKILLDLENPIKVKIDTGNPT